MDIRGRPWKYSYSDYGVLFDYDYLYSRVYSRVLFQVLHESIFESTFGVFLKHFLASFLAEIIKTFGPALWLVFSFNLLFCIYNGQKVLKKGNICLLAFCYKNIPKVLQSTPKYSKKYSENTPEYFFSVIKKVL